MEQEIKVIVERNRLLAGLLRVFVLLKTFGKVGFTFGVLSFASGFVFLANGPIGFSLQLM